MDIIHHPSPNYNHRRGMTTPDMIIIHYTGMKNAQAALERLCDPDSQVSCHYLIDKQGQIFRLVDDEYRAWHAGIAFWQGRKDINSCSLGIELENTGHDGSLEAFPDAQIQSLIQLCKDLQKKYHIPAQAVIGHSDIAPLRKKDPGEMFPWNKLALDNIGIYATMQKIRKKGRLRPLNAADFAYETAIALADIGYQVTPKRYFTLQHRASLKAFERHFCHDNMPVSGEYLRIMLQKIRKKIS
jgi:N-acetylmuramoyl-L-alanine amidase